MRRAIKHNVSKFYKIYQNVKNLNESVRNEEDIVHKSSALYQLKNPKGFDFTYERCWLIMREVQATLGGAP